MEERCATGDHGQHARQRQRWLATARLDIEPRLRKVMGDRHRPRLRDALKRAWKIDTTTSKTKAAYAIRSRGEFQLGMGLTRFFRTLKEQLLWVRHFTDVEDLQQALRTFKETYNQQWLIERLGFRAPVVVRRAFALTTAA